MNDTVQLDVRPVEPRHRFDLIMNAYEALTPPQTLELTVDHDPKCMYYALRATRGDDAFAFDYIENGPETWVVRVKKAGGEPAVKAVAGSNVSNQKGSLT